MRAISNRTVWIAAALGCLILLCGYVFLAVVGIAPTPSTCLNRREADFLTDTGIHIRVTRRSCDTLAKEDLISVLIFRNERDDKDVIFKYDPDERNPLPTVSSGADQTILISVPSVSTIYTQSSRWHGMTIKYEIGSVVYPLKAQDTIK
jgi:hypothetical protein